MRRFFLIPLVTIILGLAAPTYAANGDAEVDSLMTRIGFFKAEIVELKAQLPGLVGEDSLIIDHEMEYAQLKALEQVFHLIEYLEKNRKDQPLSLPVQTLLQTVPNSLLSAEKAVVEDLISLRTQRELIPAANMGQYEENVADLMGHTTTIQNHIFNYLLAIEKLGQPHARLTAHLQKEVPGRTRILIGRLRLSLKDESSLQHRIALPATGDDAVLLRAAHLRNQSNITNLRQLIALMKKMGLDTTSHEAFLIESTGQLTTTDLASGALMNFLDNKVQSVISYAQKNGVNLLLDLLFVVGLLVLFNYLGKLASKLVIASIDASRFRPSRLLRNMIENMSNRIVMLIGILIALAHVGISLGPMLAGLGVVGFIVGFALQDTLANFASGIMILFYRPFDVGDMVETGSVFGKVKHMSLVSTTILTIDNQTLVVPNNMIWGNVIKNVTAQNLRRVDMVFGVSYADDIPQVEQILKEILRDNKMVLKTPASDVKLHELADSSVNFVVRPWVRTENYWDVHWDVTREVKMRFDAEGVSIPFPQQDVHWHEDKAEG